MPSLQKHPSKPVRTGHFPVPPSPSPIDYPYRQFLPLEVYSEESIKACLSSPSEGTKARRAYRLKKLEGRQREVIVVYTDKELEEDDLDAMMID